MLRIKIEVAGNQIETHQGDASLQLNAYARDPEDFNAIVQHFMHSWNTIYDINCEAYTPRPTAEEAHEPDLSAGDPEASTPEEEPNIKPGS